MEETKKPNLFLAILGLSQGSILSIDGQSIILKTDDFVGIRDLPMDNWHFVTVRSSAQASITVGFVVFNTSIVRRYDPQTEEVSSTPVDESTFLNLQLQVTNGQLEQHRMIPYNRVVLAEQASLWKAQRSHVSPVLLKLRGLEEGKKIVPGSFEEETPTTQNTIIVDGASVMYPNIPVAPIRVGNAHTHTGTKRYLRQLSPSDRTSLLIHENPAGRLVNDVLFRYYQNQWQDLVGDIQLSYLLFLQLQCLGSLENWYVLVHVAC
jgi:A1 cistron-splicing factor AAR2